MKYSNYRILILLLLSLVSFACQRSTSISTEAVDTTIEKADMVLRNGNIITVDPQLPRAQALAIKDGRILSLGSNEDMTALIGGDTQLVDLAGNTAVPGLIDAHMHFPLLGKRTEQLFLGDAESPQQVLQIVAQRVNDAKPGEWIIGKGWHIADWAVQDFPDNRELNAIAPDNPVYLEGLQGHAAWVNQQVLERVGIDGASPDPEGGRIVRHAGSTEPSGILLETAVYPVIEAIPEEKHETKANFELSVKTALRLGFTSVHDAGVGYKEIAIYKELLAEGKLNVRVYVMFYVPDAGDTLAEYISNPPQIGLGNNFLTLRSIKAYADGALGARGAALLQPYADAPGELGLIPNSDEEIYQMVRQSIASGYQIAIHAIGDRANRVVLDAVERSRQELNVRDARPRIEHAQIISPQDIPRFAELGVIPSMQLIHCTMDMTFAEERLGSERLKGAYAWKSLLSSGARVAAGADTPLHPIEYTNPLWNIYAAITRQDNTGRPVGGWLAEQRVSPMQALG